MAAALALAIAPVPATSLGYSPVPDATHISTTLRANPGEVVFLPIALAIDYLKSQTEILRLHLKNVKAEWEEKDIPVDLGRQSATVQKYLVNELKKRAEMARCFLSAAKIALTSNEVKSDEAVHTEVCSFGRSASALLFIIEDFLSFIRQTHPPERTSDQGESFSADEVRAMITAEHKNLGLSEPVFRPGG
ncbi:hypothetical protein ACFFW8_22030 [Erwinia tracheiphila]